MVYSFFLIELAGNHIAMLMLSTILLSLSFIGLIFYIGYLQFIKSKNVVSWGMISDLSDEFKNLFTGNNKSLSSQKESAGHSKSSNTNLSIKNRKKSDSKSFKSIKNLEDASRFLDHYIWKYMGINHNEKDINLTHFNLYDLLNEIVNEEHEQLSNNTMKVYLDVSRESVVKSDKLKVKSMIVDILNNAMINQDLKKPHSYLKITSNHNKGSFSLVLSDNGLGLSTEHLPDIFCKNQKPKKQFKNPDFSLFLLKEYAKKLNIDIKVYSESGEGSMFVFEFENNKVSNPSPKVFNVFAN